MMSWYAIQTRSNYEKRVNDELARKGIESYLPIFREVHQWKDRKKVVEVPVFRSYVFTRFVDCAEARLAVVRCDGAVRILGSHDAISPIPEVEIESLRQMLEHATSRCMAHPLLREGSCVRMKRGPLKNLEGLLVRVKNQTRLVVSVTLLSQSVSAEVDVSDVQFVSSGVANRRVA
jgi:transcription antitermination factor NusG